MAKTTITCTTCPAGCEIVVEGDGTTIARMEGAACKRGAQYATAEYTHPERILTSLAKVEGAGVPLVPIRSRKPLPKDLLFQCMNEIRALSLQAPVNAGDVVAANICGTGVDMVATGSAQI